MAVYFTGSYRVYLGRGVFLILIRTVGFEVKYIGTLDFHEDM